MWCARFYLRSRVTHMKMSSNFLSTRTDGEILLKTIKNIVPPLTYNSHKGQCGRIGFIGGCKQYTGAPYFAAISALKAGADLVHVFCAQEAAPIIKCYSPELIVHPILDSQNAVKEISGWLPRMHSLVIGPGLGRDSNLLDNVKGVIIKAKEYQLPLVLDADAVFLISQDSSLIQCYTKTILTPNVNEFNLLRKALTGDTSASSEKDDKIDVEVVMELSRLLGNVTIVRKGPTDIISDGREVLICDSEGSPRRCGGQGDVLAGTTGLFAFWATNAMEKINDDLLTKYGASLVSAYTACLLTRECNKLAFAQHRRSTLTTDMIAALPDVCHSML